MSKKRTRTVTANDLANSFKLVVISKNNEQSVMLKTISENVITFIKGSPGTGKTYLAVSHALQQFFKQKYDRIVITRPVIEAAGEKLGFLPGDMYDKVNPYMIPIFETLAQLVPYDLVKKMISKNGHDAVIRVLPLAYMRGITFINSIIICDEMQNSTPDQVRMLLTRLGEGSKMIICGDVMQSDIERVNGLADAFKLLEGVEGVGFATLTKAAIVRHPMIGRIEERYEERNRKRNGH